MIKLERDYYREEAIKFGIICLFIMFAFAIILPFLFKYGVI
jgi:hypothetical protein